ncbi:MAG: hypothetical protein CMM93_00920 [Rickettsiales bacterium]|nr:hypothetical protein [Rickettsiales bacterium]|tara:strand:+ start:541 stop:861 length:321 start_codon:yes stop_codon:yes gene_type:complete
MGHQDDYDSNMPELHFLDDMGSGKSLVILKEPDGDLILTIQGMDEGYNPLNGEIGPHFVSESIQLCTPFSGGGAHEKLWSTLFKFFQEELERRKNGEIPLRAIRAD